MSDSIDKGRKKSRFVKLYPVAVSLLLFCFAIAHVYSARGIEILKRMDNAILELNMQVQANYSSQPFSSRIVELDTGSIQSLGFPIGRRIWADVIQKLSAAGADVIVLDVIFGESPAAFSMQTDELIEAIKKSGRVILPVYLSPTWTPDLVQWLDVLPRIFSNSEAQFVTSHIAFEGNPKILQHAMRIGISESDPDPDGVHRCYRIYKNVDGGSLNIISSISLLAYMAQTTQTLRTEILAESIKQERFVDCLTLLPVYSDNTSSISLVDMLHMDEAALQEWARGRVVFVGSSADGFAPRQPIPTKSHSVGIENQRLAYENILHGRLVTRDAIARYIEVALAVVACAMGLLLGFSRGRRKLALGVLMPLSFLVANFSLFFLAEYNLRFSGVILCSIGSWLANILYSFSKEERMRSNLENALKCYLDPHLVRLYLEEPDALLNVCVSKKIVIMFIDLRNFTECVENLDPDELVKGLNQFFNSSTQIILRNHGTLDKFIGDAIMAFWGAPVSMQDAKIRACNAAQELVRCFKDLQNAWSAQGSPFARTDIGIGIHYGDATVGNIGSSLRFNYTALGDSVNLASRIEGLSKHYGYRVLLSEELKGSERELRYVERVQVKGRQKSLELYTFFEDGYVPNEPYTMALREFQSGNFGTAEMLFIQFLFDYPNDPGVKHVLSHLHVVMRGEVKNWEGTWRFSDKY